MKKIIRILPFFLFIVLLDRFFFLPGRMDATWEYEKGINMGNPITFDNIVIINNFVIQIQKTGELNECYLLGCYFGNLYLLNSQTLKYTKYVELDESTFMN
ncbi:hypothetical protein [Flavobacterium sp.]|uniref:hypothetical protein n=1 Tax=Flavobacterium sp. TaxID=239 RepID=UPI0037BE773A